MNWLKIIVNSCLFFISFRSNNVSFYSHFNNTISSNFLFFLSFRCFCSRFPQVDKSKSYEDVKKNELEEHLQGELLQYKG